jgi:hypothetical protein
MRLFFCSILLMVILMPAAGQADENRTADFALLMSFAVIDYNQRVNMFYESQGYYEVNQVLGKSPTRGDMIAFGMIGVGLTYLLSDMLPEPWNRILIDSVIASEMRNIEENRRVYSGWNTEGPPLRGREMNAIPIIISLRF